MVLLARTGLLSSLVLPACRIPVITTLHSVKEDLRDAELAVLQQISFLSHTLVRTSLVASVSSQSHDFVCVALA